MKFSRFVWAPVVLSLSLTSCNDDSSLTRATDIPATELHKISYSLGQNMGGGLKNANIDFDPAYLYAGMADALEGKQLLTDEDMEVSLIAMQQQLAQKQMEQQMKVGEENAEKSAAYLAENASKDGVNTTESGLQYKEIIGADGDKPKAGESVTVHYEGRLIDGTVFDSSYQRGEPATFPLSGVIAGWTEGLQLMPVGSTYELTIPAELGYGLRGSPPAIGPNAALVFKVELLEIQ